MTFKRRGDMGFADRFLSLWRSALNGPRSSASSFSVTSQLPEAEVLARLRQLTGRRRPRSVKGSVDGNTFVLVGPAPPGSYPRRFCGHVRTSNSSTVIEGRFELHPLARLLLRSLSALVLVAGAATTFQQHSVEPFIAAVLVLVGGFFVIRRQVGLGASGEEAVVRDLLDIVDGRRRAV